MLRMEVFSLSRRPSISDTRVAGGDRPVDRLQSPFKLASDNERSSHFNFLGSLPRSI